MIQYIYNLLDMKIYIRKVKDKTILFIDDKEINITGAFNNYVISEFRHKKQIKNKAWDIYTVSIKKEIPIYWWCYWDAWKIWAFTWKAWFKY